MTKEILTVQREIVQGYYNRIFFEKPSVETIMQWLESDLEHLSQEDTVEAAKDIIMNYDPHEVSKVECCICKHSWVAVRPKGVERLECPNCKCMVDFENVK